MVVGQVRVTFIPMPDRFHVLKDHGERKVCGFTDAPFLPAPWCLAPKTRRMQRRARKSAKLCCMLQRALQLQWMGQQNPLLGPLETQTPAATVWG